MSVATKIATVKFCNTPLDIFHRETNKGDSFTYKIGEGHDDEGKLIAANLDRASFDHFEEFGTLGGNPFKVKFSKDAQRYLVGSVDVEIDDQVATITLTIKSNNAGGYRASLTGRFRSQGSAGRPASTPQNVVGRY